MQREHGHLHSPPEIKNVCHWSFLRKPLETTCLINHCPFAQLQLPGLPPSRVDLFWPQELVKKVLLELDEIMDLLLDVKVKGSVETTACTWIRNNRDRWDRWIASATYCVQGQGLVNADGDFVQKRSEAREFWKLESN